MATFTAFVGQTQIATGDLATVARASQACVDNNPLILDDATGRAVDLDLRSAGDDAVARLPVPPSKAPRGRPKLGVTAREVTLLPRHWDWLATQPGGASAALRRLVDQARRDTVETDARRQAQEAAYRAMTTLAGDLPGYEEATRALFASEWARFEDLTAPWPPDIRDYVRRLSAPPNDLSG